MDMQESPDPPQEFPRFVQRERIRSGEDASVRKLADRRRLKTGHPGPLEQMEIAKSALAFLHVRFEQVDCFTELLVFTPPLFQLLIEVGVGIFRNDFPEIFPVEVLKQIGAPGKKPRFHHRSLHGGVGFG